MHTSKSSVKESYVISALFIYDQNGMKIKKKLSNGSVIQMNVLLNYGLISV